MNYLQAKIFNLINNEFKIYIFRPYMLTDSLCKILLTTLSHKAILDYRIIPPIGYLIFEAR
jgi:hypothetical protein